jgi:hypothetical protein
MNSRSRLKRNVAIAVIGGGIVGGAAGFASQPHRASPAQSAQAVAIVEPVPVSAQPESASPPPAAEPQPLAGDAGRSAAVRARDMAQRGDVASLLALRDEIIRRSTQSGQTASPATQRELEEVDRYVTEARLLRLKIDGEALQKSTSP